MKFSRREIFVCMIKSYHCSFKLQYACKNGTSRQYENKQMIPLHGLYYKSGILDKYFSEISS